MHIDHTHFLETTCLHLGIAALSSFAYYMARGLYSGEWDDKPSGKERDNTYSRAARLLLVFVVAAFLIATVYSEAGIPEGLSKQAAAQRAYDHWMDIFLLIIIPAAFGINSGMLRLTEQQREHR